MAPNTKPNRGEFNLDRPRFDAFYGREQLRTSLKFQRISNAENWTPVDLFPLASRLKSYTRADLCADMRAGFNVAALSFPVNMAYALVAGLPVSFGIYSGIAASLMGLLFCRSVYVTFGPSNATAVMLLSSFAAAGLATEAERAAALPNILLMIGLFMVFVSVFKLTFFVSYISRTVVTAYVTCSALLILANQMKNLLGFEYTGGGNPVTLVDTVRATLDSVGATKPSSVATALLTMAVFLPLKRWLKRIPAEGATLVIMAAATYVACVFFGFEVDTLNAVKASEWRPTLPDFEAVGIKQSAWLALAVALLGTIEASSIGKSLASQRADRLDVNQETFALGTANVACALGSSTMASGSLTRSTLAVASGAKTGVFNLFTAAFTLVILLAFGDAVAYVPKSTLALIVVYTSVTLVKPRVISTALKSTWSDAVVFASTFLTGVFASLDDAIYAGTTVSILLFLRKASSPELVEYAVGDDGGLVVANAGESPAKTGAELSIVHVEGNMFFGASDILQNQLRRISADPKLKVLILKLRNAINLDATSVMDIEELDRRMGDGGRVLILCEVRPPAARVLRRSGLTKKMRGRIFENDDSNETLSAALAIRKAQEYLDYSYEKPGVSVVFEKPTK